MGRQLRTKRAGESVLAVNPARASSTKAAISNYGVTVLSTRGDYVLDRPEEGVRKTLVSVTTSTAAATVIWAHPTSGVITFDAAGNGKITFAAATTSRQAVELVGLNTTSWAVVNVYPPSSTAAGPTLTTF